MKKEKFLCLTTPDGVIPLYWHAQKSIWFTQAAGTPYTAKPIEISKAGLNPTKASVFCGPDWQFYELPCHVEGQAWLAVSDGRALHVAALNDQTVKVLSAQMKVSPGVEDILRVFLEFKYLPEHIAQPVDRAAVTKKVQSHLLQLFMETNSTMRHGSKKLYEKAFSREKQRIADLSWGHVRTEAAQYNLA